MIAGELKKLIKSGFLEFSKQNGFYFLKPTILIKVNCDVLQIINFDIAPNGVNCTIAIQPLYIPSEDIILSFGNRLNHFKTSLPGIWCNGDAEKAKVDFCEMKELLEKNVLPWFEDVASPMGIVRFIKSDRSDKPDYIVGFSPNLKRLYYAYSNLYLGEIDQAKDTLEDILSTNREDMRPWVLKQSEMIEETLCVLSDYPERVKAALDENTTFTKQALKII